MIPCNVYFRKKASVPQFKKKEADYKQQVISALSRRWNKLDPSH